MISLPCIIDTGKYSCYPELGKYGFFPTDPEVQTNIYHYKDSQYREQLIRYIYYILEQYHRVWTVDEKSLYNLYNIDQI